MLGRIRIEQNDGNSRIYKTTRGRAAVIKMYLLRNGNEKGEVATALNEDSNSAAYILGRESAALGAIQEDASPGIDATIEDKYFNPVCAMSTVISPILSKLKNSHIKRMNNETKEIYYEEILGDLQGGLTVAEG